MGIWYRAGTVAVTNGSAVVTGALTTFSVYVRPGDALRVGSDNRRYEVLSVDSNTQITLASNYAGTTASGAAYEIETTSYRHQIPSDILERLREVLEGQTDVFTTTGAPNNGVGSEGSIAFDIVAKFMYLKGATSWGAAIPLGDVGPAGGDGWSPRFALATDGARRVLQVASWTGGSGTPPVSGQYVGATGLVADIADAIDIRGPSGANGINGTNGTNGTNGWSPQFSVGNDGARRVLQVSSWTGGSGSPPSSGQYVGATGLVALIGDAIDIRGPSGADGAGTGDMTKDVYDPNDDGKVNAAAAADSVPWAGVSGKPSTFPPDAHGHAIADVSGLQSALDAKQAVTAPCQIEVVIDNGSNVITTGVKGELRVPFNCNIVNWTLVGDVSGSIVLDVWRDTLANYPPTVADTITGTAKPTLSSAASNSSATLTGWSVALTKGQILRFNVDSVATVRRVTLSLEVVRT